METYREFAPSQKVRNIYGHLRTVYWQDGCQVWVDEERDWYHPSKLFPVE